MIRFYYQKDQAFHQILLYYILILLKATHIYLLQCKVLNHDFHSQKQKPLHTILIELFNTHINVNVIITRETRFLVRNTSTQISLMLSGRIPCCEE